MRAVGITAVIMVGTTVVMAITVGITVVIMVTVAACSLVLRLIGAALTITHPITQRLSLCQCSLRPPFMLRSRNSSNRITGTTARIPRGTTPMSNSVHRGGCRSSPGVSRANGLVLL